MQDTQIFLHLSNDQTRLAAILAEMIRDAGSDPLATRSVIVQNRGMERWLRYQLAETNGVAMNLEFPFPRQSINSLLATMLGGAAISPVYERANLAWAIHDLLPGLVDRGPFAAVKRYLADGSSLKRYQFADHIAKLLDEYIVYRPAMINAWSRGDNPEGAEFEWQAIVWRSLPALWPEALCFADLHHKLSEEARLAPGPHEAFKLLGDIRIFGVSLLPPAFLDVFATAARHVPVHVFLLEPTPHYFGDLRARKQKGRGEPREFEIGNPAETFVGRTARHAREMIDALVERDAQQRNEIFDPRASVTCLGLSQDALCELAVPTRITTTDESIVVNSCSGQMREVQVLHSHLLHLFETLPDLRPEEILVMAPEIEDYAPAIHAEFGSHEPGVPVVPYTVADLQPRTVFRAIDAFLHVLDLVGGRFKANDLVALVEHEAIQRAFKLGESDLAQIRAWVDSAGIHWGLDSRQRAAQRQPPLRAGTWRHGVDSVLLGYALNGENGRMFDGHCPETDVEGDRARSLGAFAKIVAIIEQLEHDSRLNRSLAEWARLLERSAKELAGEVEEFKPEYFELLRVFRLLAELPAAHLQSRDESVAFVAVRASINDLVREFVPSGGFMSGGVTFSSLRPMRSVPARVICLLGINEQDFPRSLRRSRFDLLAGDPQPGDRSPRSEDRQIFLESYLSARDVFYVSYTGMDAKSGEALPCPVIVEEFLEFIGEISTIEVTQQPLLGVSRRYLRDEQLRTYSEGNWAAAKRLSDPAAPQTAFLNEPLPEPAPGDKIFTVEQLVSFFLDPVRYFLEHRLGMAISTQREDDFPDSEPFTFDRLQTYNVRKQRINELLTGEDTQMWDVLESRAALSFGPVGRAEHSDIDAVAAAFVGSIASDSISPAIARVTADLGDGYAVHGTLGEHADFLKVVVPARQSARKLLDVWLRHLLWQRAEHPAPERSTRACFMDQHGAGEMLVLNAPPDVDALIGDLGRILAIGMTRPIRFFPLASRTYAANRIKSGDDDDAHTKAYHQARGVWYNRNAASTESEEAHWTLAFGEDPLGGEEFVDLALRVWGPVYRLAGDQIT